MVATKVRGATELAEDPAWNWSAVGGDVSQPVVTNEMSSMATSLDPESPNSVSIITWKFDWFTSSQVLDKSCNLKQQTLWYCSLDIWILPSFHLSPWLPLIDQIFLYSPLGLVNDSWDVNKLQKKKQLTNLHIQQLNSNRSYRTSWVQTLRVPCPSPNMWYQNFMQCPSNGLYMNSVPMAALSPFCA